MRKGFIERLFIFVLMLLLFVPGLLSCAVAEENNTIAESISLMEDELYAWVHGHTATYHIIVNPTNAVCQFEYTTEDESLDLNVGEYYINNYYFFQLSAFETGTTYLTITDTISGENVRALVRTVEEVLSAEVNTNTVYLNVGNEQSIPVRLTLSNGEVTNQRIGVYFSSYDDTIASVDCVGRVRGVSKGKTSIMVTVSEGEATNGIRMRWIDIPVIVFDTDKVLELPDDTRIIEAEAFEGTDVGYVIIPDGCERIESRAFANCLELQYVRIPSSVVDLAEDAFDNCPNAVIDKQEF